MGETYAGYFFPESVPHIVAYLRPILLAVGGVDRARYAGAESARMRTCFQYWGRVGLGAAVLAGIEGALWDWPASCPACPYTGCSRPSAGHLPA